MPETWVYQLHSTLPSAIATKHVTPNSIYDIKLPSMQRNNGC